MKMTLGRRGAGGKLVLAVDCADAGSVAATTPKAQARCKSILAFITDAEFEKRHPLRPTKTTKSRQAVRRIEV